MSEVIEITVSSQMKSANATSDIAFHSGKENREKFNHANKDIDVTLTHMNVVLDIHDRDELLHAHYDELIAKHNKNNNSEARRWDLEKYLATFEGKRVKVGGKVTENERWATVSQISYFGGKDSLNPVLERLHDAGATEKEIMDAYASGYKEYVEAHNAHFPTLPIYRSDIHFDEMTPHGHDAIVVMGHTEKGRPSDSLNNALGELYGYAKTFDGRQANMERYRDENDTLMFDAMAPALETLGNKYGLDFKFEPIRTGQTDSVDYKEYKKKKDLEGRELEISKKSKTQSKVYSERLGELKERKVALDSQEAQIISERASQALRERELREREEKLLQKERELAERAELLAIKEKAVMERAERVGAHNASATAVALAVLHGDDRRQALYERIEKHGVSAFHPDSVREHLVSSIKEANSGIRRRSMGGERMVEREYKRMGGPEL